MGRSCKGKMIEKQIPFKPAPVEEDDEDAPLGLKDLLMDFFGNRFSAHGIPRVANSRGRARRLAWAGISIVFIVLLGVQTWKVLQEYYSYHKQVTIQMVEVEEVVFPSLTICNFNVVQLSKLEDSQFSSLMDQEGNTDTGDCSNYDGRAPWVTNKDYKPFTSKEYWTMNNLESGKDGDAYVPATTASTTSTSSKAPATDASSSSTDTPSPSFSTTPESSPTTTTTTSSSIPSTSSPPSTSEYTSSSTPSFSTTTDTSTSPPTDPSPGAEKIKRMAEEIQEETLDEYKDYRRTYDNRSQSVQWCRQDDPDDCLETFGLENIDRYNFTTLLEFSKRSDLSDIKNTFTPDADDIYSLGILPQEFITSCSFDKKACSFKDFYVWQSDSYGNCFTFNSPNLYERSANGSFTKDNYLRNTSKSGFQHGLRLTLNLDIKNYVSLLSADLGVRVVVHQPSVTPVPEQEGLSAAPGFLTSIALRMKRIVRIGHPYGRCQPRKWKAYPRDYSQTSCRMLCLEQHIQEECQCSNAINDLLLALKTSLPRCNPTNLTQDLCRQIEVKRAYDPNYCDCPPACEEIIYTPLVSMNQVNRRFLNLVKNAKSYYVGEDVCSDADNGTVRLHVYLESLQQEVITEKEAKTAASLLAEIGGNLGLFIGLSLVTLLELVEFLLDLLLWGGRGTCHCFCGERCRDQHGKRRGTSSTVTPINLPQDDIPEPADYRIASEVKLDGFYKWKGQPAEENQW